MDNNNIINDDNDITWYISNGVIHCLFLLIIISAFFIIYGRTLSSNLFNDKLKNMIDGLKDKIGEFKNNDIYNNITNNEYVNKIIIKLKSSYDHKNLLIEKNNDLIIRYIIFINIFCIIGTILFFYYILGLKLITLHSILSLILDNIYIFIIICIIEYIFFSLVILKYSPVNEQELLMFIKDTLVDDKK